MHPLSKFKSILEQKGYSMVFRITSVFCLIVFTLSSTAAGSKNEHPYLVSNQSLSAIAVVEEIDQETRLVKLRTTEGRMMTFTAGETVHNLEQVAVGDVVDYEYVSNMSVILVEQPGAIPSEQRRTSQSTAGVGEKPRTETVDTRVQTAKIVAIDHEASTYSLEWPDESVQQYTAKNPENLSKASVGDHIVITSMERMVISVEKPEQE